MPTRKIPPDAFMFYVSLGLERSYQKVAEKYGVTKRAVTKLAAKERWQEQVEEMESKARETAQERARAEIGAVYERHMKALRLVFGKGVEALRQMVIEAPADAMRAIRMAIQEERVALGEPTDRTAISVEDTIRREYERLMTVEGGEEDEEEEDEVDDDDDVVTESA